MSKLEEAAHSEEVTCSDVGLSLKGPQSRAGPGWERRRGSAKDGSSNSDKNLSIKGFMFPKQLRHKVRATGPCIWCGWTNMCTLKSQVKI